jgi:hypothetical protein
MAETTRTFTHKQISRDVVEVKWTGLDGDDVGEAVDLSQYPDKSVQVSGVFDSGIATLYWSNDSDAVKADRAAGTASGSYTAAWVIAQDSLGNNIAKSAAGGDQILEAGHWFQPRVASGAGSCLLNVTITARRNKI